MLWLWPLLGTAFSWVAKLPWQVWIIVALALGGLWVYHKGDEAGSARVQARWDQAVRANIANANRIGSKANADAQVQIKPLSPADIAGDAAIVPRPRLSPCDRVRDAFDRSCR